MQEKTNEFFATAKPWRLFFIVALPGLVSMLAASLYSAAEGAFIGKLIGEAAFAAINLGFPVVFINFAFADLIGVGSSAPIANALGRADTKTASNIFSASVLMIFVTGIISGVALFFAAPFFISLMGAEGELLELAVRYVRIFAVLSPCNTIVFATDNYLRISGFVKGSMLLNILMTVLTVSFLAVYIIGFSMNVDGAALASCTSMFICALIAITPFVLKKSVLKFVRPKFSLHMIRQIVFCGLPVFLNNIAGRITAILMNSALIRLGGQTAVAAFSVLMYSAGIVEPMLYGLVDSVQPAIGFNHGAGSLDRVRNITKCSLLVCAGVSVLSTAVMLLFPSLFTFIFVADGETVLIEMSLHALRIFASAFLFGWMSFAVQGFLSSIERPLPAMIISVCRALIFPVILIYALSFMGLDGLWLNYTATAFLTMLLSLALIIPEQKRLARNMKPQASEPAVFGE